MFFKTLAAAFFLERGSSDRSLGEMLTLAGMQDLQNLSDQEKRALAINDPSVGVIYGHWDTFGDAWSLLDRLQHHDCLQIYFSMNHFLDLRPEKAGNENLPLEQDPSLPMAYTFRDACERLQPEVAFVDTYAHYGDETWENKQGNRAWILDHYSMVLESNANELADERFGLLYLNDYMSQLWDSNRLRDDRDAIPVSSGCLVFARRGWARWS